MDCETTKVWTLIRWGDELCFTEAFNLDSTMDDIHELIRAQLFPNRLESYRIEVYNTRDRKMISLNQNELDFGFNPFKSVLRQLSVCNGFFLPQLELNIVRSNELSSVITDFAELLPVTNQSSNETNQELHPHPPFNPMNDESSPVGLATEEVKADGVETEMDPLTLANENRPSVSLQPNHADVPESLAPSTDTDDSILQELLSSPGWLLSPVGPAPSPSIPLGDVTPFTSPLLGGASGSGSCEFDRLHFCHDVQEKQKTHYLSDEFNRTTPEKKNGQIPCIQGTKTEEEKMIRVLPKLHIPLRVSKMTQPKLITYAVKEVIRDGQRQWYTHPRKKFLPAEHSSATVPCNPIETDWTGKGVTGGSIYELKLQMVTLWDKSRPEVDQQVFVTELAEEEVLQLHPALHQEGAVRLLCQIKDGNGSVDHPLCLSNFITPPLSAAKKRKLNEAELGPSCQ